MKIFVPGEFSTANEYIAAANKSHYASNAIKATETQAVQMIGMSWLNSGNEPVRKYPVDLHFHWTRKDDHWDPGNVAFAEKFVTDGLVKSGILKSDAWKFIRSISHTFEIDPIIQGVEVTIEEK